MATEVKQADRSSLMPAGAADSSAGAAMTRGDRAHSEDQPRGAGTNGASWSRHDEMDHAAALEVQEHEDDLRHILPLSAQQPEPDRRKHVPFKALLFALLLIAVGLVCLSLCVYFVSVNERRSAVAFLVVGVVSIIPGSYQGYVILQTWRGVPGFSYDMLPFALTRSR